MSVAVRGQIALLLEVAFAGLAIGVRVALQWRRTGTTGIALTRMGRTRADRVVLTSLALAVLSLGLATLAALDGRALGGLEHVAAPVVVAGVIVAALAIVATFWAQLAMGASWRIGLDRAERTALVTRGPYRWVRNPIYSAMLVFIGAIYVVLPGSATAFAIVVSAFAIEVVVRRIEEPFLLASHGAAFAQWAARAGRFVPGVGVNRRHRDVVPTSSR
jgi:protein-S-isoprenylcysteine O-methyltransferase Ste14